MGEYTSKSLRELVEVLADAIDSIRAHANAMEKLERRIEVLEDALEDISRWSDAYPLSVFPEPDFARAMELLEAGGMMLDSISASNMRHVVEGVGNIAKTALAGGRRTGGR